MVKYIVRDLRSVLHFWPYGIVAGLVVLIFLLVVNPIRRARGKAGLAVPGTVCFYMYLVILFVITFFSRETGSENGMDLELFSSWGINDRNNAYVVENILLFIPYGLFTTWYLGGTGVFMRNAFIGFLTSATIEFLQLFTGRGVFQIDDILTNFLGSILGWVLFCCVSRLLGRKHHADR